MAIPTGDILRVQIGGAVPSDTWSCSFWFALTGLGATPTPSQMNSAANALLGGFKTSVWLAGTSPWSGQCSTGTSLTTGKSYLYRSSLLVASGSASVTGAPGAAGTSGPNYVARCITTLTNQPGRSRRGRFYLPQTAGSVTASTGLFASISTALGNMAGLLGSASGAQSSGYFFGGSETASYVVVSSTHGYTTHITSLRADNVPDTQHGRENKLVATVTDAVTVS
jgi:hypothetical protein